MATLGEMYYTLGMDTTQFDSAVKRTTGLVDHMGREIFKSSEAVVKSQEKIGAAAEKMGTRMQRGGSSANVAVMSLGRGVSDLAYGWQFALNNLDPFIASLSQARREAQNTGTTLSKSLISALKGPGGLVLALGAVELISRTLGPTLEKAFSRGSQAAREAKKAFDEALGSMLQFEDAQGYTIKDKDLPGAIATAKREINRLKAQLGTEKAADVAAFGVDDAESGAFRLGVQLRGGEQGTKTRINRLESTLKVLEGRLSTASAETDIAQIMGLLGARRDGKAPKLTQEQKEALRFANLIEQQFGSINGGRGVRVQRAEGMGGGKDVYDAFGSGTPWAQLASPETLEGLRQVPQVFASINDEASTTSLYMAEMGEVLRENAAYLVDDLAGAFTMSFASALTGIESVSDALKSMGREIKYVIRDLVSAIAKAAILKGISSIFGLGGVTSADEFGGAVIGAIFGGGKSSASIAAPRTQVEIIPRALPSGDLAFAISQGETLRNR